MNRADFRARTVGAPKQFRKQMVDIGDGTLVEVRQPSVKARAAILKAAQAMSRNPEAQLELAELQVEAVLRLCFLEDGRPAFESADRESLLEQPAGGWFDELAEVATSMLNIDEKDLKKNSSGAPTAESSS